MKFSKMSATKCLTNMCLCQTWEQLPETARGMVGGPLLGRKDPVALEGLGTFLLLRGLVATVL